MYEVVDFDRTYQDQNVCDEIMEYVLHIANSKAPEVEEDKKTVEHRDFNEMDLV